MNFHKPIQGKVLSIMRITCTQLTLALTFSAFTYASDMHGQGVLEKKIHLKAINERMKSVLRKIETQASVTFTYNADIVKKFDRVTVEFDSTRLSDALDRLFENTIDYKVVSGQIVLRPFHPVQSQTEVNTSSAIAITVSGTILDDLGVPLPGVNIVEKGTSNGTTSDNNGKYTIVVTDENSTLVFSFIGYVAEEAVVGDRTVVDLTMTPDITSLGEVVIIGYQSAKKEDLTGAVSIVKADDLKKLTVTSVGDALQGLAAGVNVRGSGQAGAEAIVEIRGSGSLLNNAPMYVIDGQPLTTANRDFNPNDIETIQVLKDASAAAIYGSRAANGVIIITTKKGHEGPMKVSFSSKVGIQEISRRWDLANSAEFVELNKLAYDNAGVPYMFGVDNFNANAPHVDTDWQDAVMKQGSVQDYDLSFSGGSANSSYFVSGNYFKNDGTIIGTSFERKTLRVNTEGKKGVFKFGENFLGSYSTQDNMEGNPFVEMLQMLPIMNIRNSNNLGGFNTGDNDYFTTSVNPVALNTLDQRGISNLRLKGNFYAEVKPLSWLTYRFNLAAEIDLGHTKFFRRPGRISKDVLFTTARLEESRYQNLNVLTEHTLNFKKKFDRHSIDGVVGFNFQKDKGEDLYGAKEGFTLTSDSSYLDVMSQGSQLINISGGISKWAAQSYFGRINYNYADRYLLSATVRRESDSRFSKNFRNATFPSFSAAWRISNESFFSDVELITELKLRASYGSVGNITIAPWQYQGSINPNPRYLFSGTTQLPGAIQTAISNQNLKWEVSKTIDIGVETSLLDNQVSFSIDYFKRKSEDVLTTDNPIPAYLSGTSSGPYPAVNAASLENNGIEISATYRKVDLDKFRFDVTANITSISNKITGLGQSIQGRSYIQTGQTRSEVGRSLGEYYMYQSNGIFQSQAEIDSYRDADGNLIQPNARPGDIRYVDIDGKGGITAEGDRVYRGSPWPTMEAGLVFNVAYGNFSLNMIFFGSFGRKLLNGGRSRLDLFLDNSNYRSGIRPWTPENPNTDIPRSYFGAGDESAALNVSSLSDRWLEDGSYVRLRNIEISYTIPTGVLSKIRFDNARIFISGQNLLTFTGYTGLDPEISNGNIFQRGIDYGNYPVNRLYAMGIQLGF